MSVLDEFLTHLAMDPEVPRAGLTDDECRRFEDGLGTSLPEPLRALYLRCGGMSADAWRGPDRTPMRLMTPSEVLEDEATLREAASTYRPSPDARYVFGDDNSNWAGIFVRGPLLGKMCFLDHDETSAVPRFRDLNGFLSSFLEAARRQAAWTEMKSDYPASGTLSPDLATRERQLAETFLAQYRAAESPEDRDAAVEAGLFLLPTGNAAILREYLKSNEPWRARWQAIRVATSWGDPALVPELVTCSQDREFLNFTRWGAILRALVAAGAHAEAEAAWAAGEAEWKESRKKPSAT